MKKGNKNKTKAKMRNLNLKLVIGGVVGIFLLILFSTVNPFSHNDGGARTVVQQWNGNQFVQFNPGWFYAGFFAKETEWPNQISVTYQKDEPDLRVQDNGIEIGMINIMFSDGTRADVRGITQFVLPSSEKDMILINNTHRTPQSLVTKRLATFTKECLQSSAQLMSSDKHYGGGRAQMSQDFLDQLRNGVYLSETQERVTYDSIEKENKRLYITEIKKNTDGSPKRKASAIQEYEISVADASINDVDYEPKVDDKLAKIIDASTKSAVSRQNLMTAQQEALTAEAEGKKNLVSIEYEQRQEQTKEVVQAETKVKVAEQDKLQQKIAFEAAVYQAKKVKELADGEAYAKKAVMIADGALTQKLSAWTESQKYWADAFGKYQGNVVPTFQTGGGMGGPYANNANNGALSFMDVITAKAAKDLALDLKNSTAGNK